MNNCYVMLVMCSWNPVYKHYRDAFTSHIPVFTTDITHVAVVLFVTDFFCYFPLTQYQETLSTIRT